MRFFCRDLYCTAIDASTAPESANFDANGSARHDYLHRGAVAHYVNHNVPIAPGHRMLDEFRRTEYSLAVIAHYLVTGL
jgi:hypothetical protein